MAEDSPNDSADGREDARDDDSETVPDDVVDDVEHLTRLARRAVDDAEASAYRAERAELLAEYDYAARVREEDDAEVLVCYPAEWKEDGVIRPGRVDDLDRGVERRLSGTGDRSDWDDVAERNDELVARVKENHDAVHAENARALADFASNHYVKPVEELTRDELREFLAEYFPRNCWPTDRQQALVEDSIGVTFEKTDRDCPLDR